MFIRRDLWRRLFVLSGLVIGVFILVINSPIEAQNSRPSRLSIEQIPHLAGEENPETESVQSIQSPEILSWSKVAFQSFRDDNWNIYVGNDDGSGQARLTTNNVSEIQPHLNRGNTQIVYARRDGDYEIFKMNVDGSNQVALTNDGTDDGNPVWSPDGTKIAFESYRDGQAEIYVMNANGSGQTRLTAQGDFDGMPTWSPDGTKIAFVSRRTGGYRIWVMNANGTNQVQVSTQAYSFRPQWSPDGTQIAFDADSDGDGWQDLWRMNADGSGQVKVYDPLGTTDAWAGSWSPDGRFIAFTTISFIQYQGNWYWTNAFIDAWNIQNAGFSRLSLNGLDWAPRWQTSDISAPASAVTNMPAQSPGPIPISWTGIDQGGSGISRYDVQVKVGASGAWTDWLKNTVSKSGQYPGKGGTTYYFRVRSRDKADNVENWPAGHDTFTTVENLLPVSNISNLSPFTRYNSDLIVNWGGNDPGGSGIANYDVQYRVNGNAWNNWHTDTTETSDTLGNIQPGEVIDFRVRATDRAQNAGTWHNANGSQTIIYRWGISGTIFDNTHTPIGDAIAETLPEEVGTVSSDVEGNYGTYVVANSNSYGVTWNKPAYGTLSETSFPAQQDKHLDVVLPPTDNLITNWGFETGTFAPDWSVSGTLPPFITQTTSHTGQTAVWLGNTQTVALEEINGGRALALDSKGRAHVVWHGTKPGGNTNEIFYTHKLDDGSWTTPIDISSGMGILANSPKIVITPDGKIHVLWEMYDSDYTNRLVHVVRNLNGVWSSPVPISQQSSQHHYIFVPFSLVRVSESGRIHVAWMQSAADRYHYFCGDDLYHAKLNDNGTWSPPEKLTNFCDYSGSSNRSAMQSYAYEEIQMVIVDETVHLLWNIGDNNKYYFQKPNNGPWLPLEDLTSSDRVGGAIMEVDSKQNVHILFDTFPSSGLRYRMRDSNGIWSEPIIIDTDPFNGDFYMKIDSTDTLHFVGQTFDQKFKYATKTLNTPWTEKQEIQDFSGIVSAPMIVDGSDTLHLVLVVEENGVQTVRYAVKAPSDYWEFDDVIFTVEAGDDFPRFGGPVLDAVNNLHLLIIEYSPHDFTNEYFYYGPKVVQQNYVSSFSQNVSIPVTMTPPILSFMYQLGGMNAAGSSSLVVSVNDGQQNVVVNQKENSGGWTHEWVDLSDWVGETIEVKFGLNQAANTNAAWAVVDEVTIGSTNPDVWVAKGDDTAVPGSDVTHVISYGNRGGAAADDITLTYTLPADMSFVSASIPPVSTNPLVWNLDDLPAKSEKYEIEVTVLVKSTAPGFTDLVSTAVISTTATEPELLNNQDTGNTFTAAYVYLPTIHR